MNSFARKWGVLAFVFTAVLAVGAASGQGSFVNFENPHNHPIDMSPDGSTLASVNTAANRVDLWDLSSGTPVFTVGVPVGYDPVTVRWRTNAELWCVNHISDSISIIDAANAIVTETVDTLDEPCDVVFAGTTERAFVSCSSVNIIQVFNPTTFAETGQVEIAAEDPRALSVSADGTKVYAAIFESGNGTTLIAGTGTLGIGHPPNGAEHAGGPYGGVTPPPNENVGSFDPMTFNWNTDAATFFDPDPVGLPVPPDVGVIVQFDPATGDWLDDNGVDWSDMVDGPNADRSGRPVGWTLVDRDVAIIDANNPTGVAVQYVEHLMNHNMAMGVNPNTGDITVVGTDATNVIRFEPNITGTFIRVNLAIVDDADIVNGKTIKDLNEEHLDAAQAGVGTAYQDGSVLQSERDKSIGDPRAIEWLADGSRGFVVGMGSNNLVIVDSAGDRFVTGYTVELQEGPTGIALDEARSQLYTMNRFNGSISVVDIATPGSEVATATVPFFDPTPDAIKTGRVHLYGTHENSGLGQISCASCHIDSRKDRLAWDLGDPGGSVDALQLITSSGDLGNRHNPLFSFDGESLDDFHPMKGPMTTQTLQDIIGKEPLHWRGDRDGLEGFAGAFQGLQGDDAPLAAGPMQEFEDFLATTHFPPNPFRNIDNTLSTSVPLPRQFANGRFALNDGDPMPATGDAQNGLTIYRRDNMDGGVSCAVCHTLPIGNSTDMFRDGALVDHAIPAGPMGEAKLALFDGDLADQRTFKVPQMRAIFDKAGFEMTPGNESLAGFGLFHDGSIDSITRFVTEPVFAVADDQEVADLVALMFSFSGGFDVTSIGDEFPISQTSNDAHAAVGVQTTFDSSSKNLTLLNQLVTEADTVDAFQIDLIAKTTQTVSGLGDVPRGWVYDAGTNLFISDQANEAGIDQTTLLAGAAPGAEITFTATPLGTGNRLGIDRDEDNLSDFDEVRDLDLFAPGIQNPFDPDSDDSTGDNGQNTPDGTPDGQNDYDGDGTDNATEFAQIGGTPIGPGASAGLPATQNWGLILTLALMAAAVAGAATLLRRRMN